MANRRPIEFPQPRKVNGRLFWVEFEVEGYKRDLAGLPPLPRSEKEPVKLIPAARVASDLGICRRTLGRRFAPGIARPAAE